MTRLLSSNLMKDRVDVIGRPQVVENSTVIGQQEVQKTCNVPCLITTINPSRFQSLFGFQQTTSLTCLMKAGTNIAQGDVIQANPNGTRFQVKRVAQFPAAHNPRFLVLDIVEDLGESI
jgi:hypothetical protein